MKDMVVDYLTRGRLATVGYYKIQNKQRNAYKMNIFMKFIGFPIRILLPLLLWQIISIMNSPKMLHGYSYYVLYYIGVFVITLMYPYTRVATATVSADILNGDLIRYIARGIPYWSIRLAELFSAILWYLGTVGVAYVLMVEIIIRDVSIISILGFIVTLFIGSLIQLVLWVMIGMSAFILEQVQGVARLYMVMQDLFTGALIPLTLLPHTIARVADWLPFKYFVFVPIQTLLEQYSMIETLKNVGLGVIWLGYFQKKKYIYNIDFNRIKFFYCSLQIPKCL